MLKKLLVYFLLVVFGFGLAFSVRVPVTKFIKQAKLDVMRYKHVVLGAPTTNFRWTLEDIEQTVKFEGFEEVTNRRESLRSLILGQWNSAVGKSLTVENNIVDERYSDLSNLARIDHLKVSLDFGLESHVYLFVPEEASDQTVIYHQGHVGDFYSGKATIATLIANGVTVAAFSMPLLGLNEVDEVIHPKSGTLSIKNHEHLSIFQPKEGTALKFFLQPVKVVIDYLEKQGGSNFSMLGVSGGGWTTAVYAAMDPRIKLSMPVAGSLPMRYKFADTNSLGDYESRSPQLSNLVSYPELYILGSIGAGRRQVQVSNFYDPCCYAGDAPLEYQEALEDKLASLGPGKFEAFIDFSHTKHQISPAAVDLFLSILQNSETRL